MYYVERSVEEFEEEVKTLKDQVQSFTDDLRSKLLGGSGGGSGGETGGETEPYRIEVKDGESDEDSGKLDEDSGKNDESA